MVSEKVWTQLYCLVLLKTQLPNSFTLWAGVEGLYYYYQQNIIYPCMVAKILGQRYAAGSHFGGQLL
jgi:hypothetical protein